ncbi:hypothetical protein NF212_25385 (plasmid) [Parasalinivibrio latis]|uniref:hypothetical protein n=1 Tax=Parasalinivibrio latis TaxID=2952610 RepID=UPI0030E26E4C
MRQIEEEIRDLVKQDALLNEGKEPYYSDAVLHALRCYKSANSYPPAMMGKILGGLHWSKVNRYLDELGLQYPKETGKPRRVTKKGEQHCSGLGHGLRWKFSAIKLLSATYGLPVLMPTSFEMDMAGFRSTCSR